MLVVGLLLGASVAYGFAALVPPGTASPLPETTSTTSSSAAPASSSSASIEALVILDAPYNGTAVSVEATAAIGANHSALHPGSISAEYFPGTKSSPANFLDYSGEVFSGSVSGVPQDGELVTVSVSYGGHSGSGTATVFPGQATVFVPVSVSTSSGSASLQGAGILAALSSITVSNNATCLAAFPHALWFSSPGVGFGDVTLPANTCAFRGGEAIAQPVTIAKGVTLYVPSELPVLTVWTNSTFTNYGTILNDGFFDNLGSIVNHGLIDNNATGVYSFHSSGIILNEYSSVTGTAGQIRNEGGSALWVVGSIQNGVNSTIDNIGGMIYVAGSIYNSGTINNGGNDYYTSTIRVLGGLGIIYNRGTIDNTGGLLELLGGTLVNSGRLYP